MARPADEGDDVFIPPSSPAPPSPFAPPIPPIPLVPEVAVAPTAGMGLSLDQNGKVPSGTLQLAILAADPAVPFEGQVWLRSDTNQLRWREGAVTYQVTGTAV